MNKTRSSSRLEAQQNWTIFKAGCGIASKMVEIKPLLKKAEFVSEQVLEQANKSSVANGVFKCNHMMF